MKLRDAIRLLHSTEILDLARNQCSDSSFFTVDAKVWKTVRAERDKVAFRIIDAVGFPFNS